MTATTDYDVRAQAFLDTAGLTFKAHRGVEKCPPFEDGQCIHGDHYRVTLRRIDGLTAHCDGRPRSLTISYWNSHNDMQRGIEPTAYDVLTCMGSDITMPDTFEDFCRAFGKDWDSCKAFAMFTRCARGAERLRAFFTEDEAEQLSEIQ